MKRRLLPTLPGPAVEGAYSAPRPSNGSRGRNYCIRNKARERERKSKRWKVERTGGKGKGEGMHVMNSG